MPKVKAMPLSVMDRSHGQSVRIGLFAPHLLPRTASAERIGGYFSAPRRSDLTDRESDLHRTWRKTDRITPQGGEARLPGLHPARSKCQTL